MTGDLSLRIATRTDVGLKRQRNEDHLATRRVPLGHLLVVCDGMGGHAGGAQASGLAAEAIVSTIEVMEGAEPGVAFPAAYAAARQAVAAHVLVHPDHATMGTTAVSAIVRDGTAHIANLGDSRAYLLHAGTLRQITRDHSLVAEMVARGEITEQEAASHPRRNVITRAISANERDVDPDLTQIELAEGDTLLLCTDGLHGMIDDGTIALHLATPDPAQAADRLVEAALAAGGLDNISVIVARRGDARTESTLVAPRTDPGESAPPPASRARVGLRWLVPLLLLAALAGAWFLWVGPRYFPDSGLVPDSDTTATEDGTGVGQYDVGAENDLLRQLERIGVGTVGMRSPAPSDSAAVDRRRLDTGTIDSMPQPLHDSGDILPGR